MKSVKKTLVLGASPKQDRYSNRAASELMHYGHPVELLGNKKGQIKEQEIDTQAKNYKNIDTVTMYLGARNQVEYYQYLIALNPKRIVFNPGAENPELCKRLEKNGVECLEACTLVMLSIGNY
ncbi:MAG: putative CoA-binding protein [Bacteroidia bacterium]|jgi:predicted CoA-binding protein